MSLPIRVDVSPSLHPGILALEAKTLNQEDTVGPKALAAAGEALSAMYRVAGEISDAERACAAAAARKKGKGDLRAVRGGSRVFHGQEEELAQASGQAVERALVTVDRRLGELNTYREALGNRVGTALLNPQGKTPETLAVATEIRSHVKGLSKSRLDFLKKAVEAEDKRTVAAVLDSPPYLSGLKPDQLTAIREIAAEKWAPVDYAQLGAVGRAIERVELGVKLLKNRQAELAQHAGDSPGKKAAKSLEELANGKK